MDPDQWDELDWYMKLTYLEGFAMEGLLRSPDAPPGQPSQQVGGRTHKIETLVPVQQIPGVANWVSTGFMDGVNLPVGVVS